MNFLKKSILLSIALCCSNLLSAQIYVEISDCTKELHYKYTAANGTDYEYYDYHFALNDYETVILEISKNAFKPIAASELSSASVLKCGSDDLVSELTVEVIEEIHKNKQTIMLVKQTANGYVVGKAMEAIYSVYLPNDKYLRVVGREYGFDYDGSSEYEKGAELKTAGAGSFVLFSTQQQNCYDKPSFMHVPVNFMETSTIDYILGIGRVRQYSDEMEHQLVAIDGQPLEGYLNTMCNQTLSLDNPVTMIEENVDIPSEGSVEEIALEAIEDVIADEIIVEGVEAFAESVVIETEEPTAKPAIVEETVALSIPTITEESVKNDVVIETTKPIVEMPIEEEVALTVPSLENLVPNVEEETIEIFVQEETVKIVTVPSIEALKNEDGEIDMSLVDVNVAELMKNAVTSEKGGTVFKSNPITKEHVERLEAEKDKNANLHTVVKGETLYSISKKYDLTTLELKVLNDLEDNKIEIGQKLKVKE